MCANFPPGQKYHCAAHLDYVDVSVGEMADAHRAEGKVCVRMAELEAVPAAEGREKGLSRNDAGGVDGKVAPDRAEAGGAGAAIGDVVDIQPREEAQAVVVLGVDSTWKGDLGKLQGVVK